LRNEGIDMIMDHVQGTVGLLFANGRAQLLEKKVMERQKELGIENSFSYFLYLKHKARDQEIVELIDRLAISETYFYREAEQFRVLKDRVLAPLLNGAFSDYRNLKILSAGCSSGEEPYTLAMIVLELLGEMIDLRKHSIKIVACDINAKLLKRAKSALYNEWSIRHLPPEYREKYLTKTDNGWEVDDEVKSLVEFRTVNLNQVASWTRTPGFIFDVVFCRNVLIYFADDRAQKLLEGIFEVTRPGGYLFTASTESLLRYTDLFVSERIDEVFLYKRQRYS
jgi:chemotaxis protein methyltransferase CheR